MIKVICQRNCPEPFCITACPSDALAVKEQQVVVEPDRCHGCGICRYMCMTWSRDHSMRTKSRFWLAGRL